MTTSLIGILISVTIFLFIVPVVILVFCYIRIVEVGEVGCIVIMEEW